MSETQHIGRMAWNLEIPLVCLATTIWRHPWFDEDVPVNCRTFVFSPSRFVTSTFASKFFSCRETCRPKNRELHSIFFHFDCARAPRRNWFILVHCVGRCRRWRPSAATWWWPVNARRGTTSSSGSRSTATCSSRRPSTSTQCTTALRCWMPSAPARCVQRQPIASLVSLAGLRLCVSMRIYTNLDGWNLFNTTLRSF